MPSESTDPVNAAFFGLAFTAALNPKLLGADLLIIENLRPRAMFICFLAGGLGMNITIGIVDVLFVQADAVKTQGSVSASVDLALWLCLLVFGALVATDRVGRRRTRRGGQGPELVGSDAGPAAARARVRDRRAGRDDRASYILGLKQLVQSNDAAGVQVVGVLLFCLIQFSPMIIPFLCL
jgi:hypothetical protein